LLNFFKSNNPGVVVFYIIYLVLFRLWAFVGPIDCSFISAHQEPLSKLFFGLGHGIMGKNVALNLSLSAILCFVQALLINNLVNENKFLSKKNALAGLLFIIVFSYFKESLVFGPALIALTFLILCTQKIFSLIKKEKAAGDAFDIGFLVALATLFYFPSVAFIIFAFFGLGTLRSFDYKEWVALLSGFIAPFILLYTLYLWNDRAPYMLGEIANLHGKGLVKALAFEKYDWILIGSLSLLSLASFAFLPTALYSSLIQVRKYAGVLVLFVLLVIGSFFLQQTINLGHLVLLALPLSVIFSMVLMQIKNKWVAEVIHIMLILLVLAGQYLPLLNIF
jgi:hypothetical protein